MPIMRSLNSLKTKADEKPEAEARKEPQKLEALEEMIVTTGSRLQQAADQVELGPIVSIDAEELLHQGTVRVEELVRSLPSVFTGGQDASNANGASGIATLNLRHLGDTVGAAAQSHVALHQQRRRSQLHPGRSRGAALLRPGRYLELQ